MSKRIGNLPANINIMNPLPNKDAKSISKLIRNNGNLHNAFRPNGALKPRASRWRSRAASAAWLIASRNGSEYLRSPAGRL